MNKNSLDWPGVTLRGPKKPGQSLISSLMSDFNRKNTHFPLSLIASSNLPSAMAAVTSLVCNNKSNTEHERWRESFPVKTSRDVRRAPKIWLIILRLTTCTHSMSGSLTAWFPDRLTTQAGVSGVASSSAITASTPILLPWSVNTQLSDSQSVCYRSSSQ